MTIKNKVIVRIMGQEYTLVSDDSREYMQKVSNLVDDKMREITASNKKLSTSMIAVLTALNAMDEYLKLQIEKENYLKRQADPSIEMTELRKSLTNTLTELEMSKQESSRLGDELEKMLKNSKDYEQGITTMRTKIDELNRKLAEKDADILAIRAEQIEMAERLSLKEKELIDFIETFESK